MPQNKADDWIYAFNKEFSFWLDNFHMLGRFQYLKLNEVREKFKNDTWFTHKNRCPYLYEIVGYINWEWWTNNDNEFEDKKSMLLEWLAFSNGFIIRLDIQQFFDPITILKYPLEDVQFRYGFEQGQVFLKNVSTDYLDDLKSKVLNVLAKKGIDICFSEKYSTGRNELYIFESIPEGALDYETIEFWGFDIRAANCDSWKTFINK